MKKPRPILLILEKLQKHVCLKISLKEFKIVNSNRPK